MQNILNPPQRPAQLAQRDDLLLLLFVQDIAHRTEGIPHVRVNVLITFSWAGFQVTTIGRFWVTAEGFPTVALMGSSLSGQQQQLLTHHFTGALIMLDGDDAGKQGTEECLVRLGRKMWVKAIELSDGTQPDQLSVEELSSVLT